METLLIELRSILIREGTKILPLFLFFLGVIVQTGSVILVGKLIKRSVDRTWKNNITNHMPKVTRQLIIDRDVVIKTQAAELKVLREQVGEMSVAVQGAVRQSNIINEILHIPAAQAEINVKKREQA